MKKMNGIVLAGEPMALLMAKLEGPLDTVTEYSVGVAGAEFNVAVGMVRLKHKVAYATKLGNDPFGKFIVNEMNKNGISTELTTFSEQRSTGMMLKGLTSVGDPQIAYFRKGSAASTLSPEDIDRLNFDGFDVLHMTGITAALSDSAREATRCLIKRGREHGMLISFDPNLRPQLWPSRKEMYQFMNEIATQVDIFFPGIGEGRQMAELPNATAEEICSFYRRLGCKLVITKDGSAGAFFDCEQERGCVPGFRVDHIVDTVGAGDGFATGVLSALMEGLTLPEAVLRGNAIGAIQVMSRGDNDGLPTREELEHFLRNKIKKERSA